MWGKTINSHTYMQRVANHSTKGSKRGYCDIGVVVDEKELIEDPQQVRERLKELIKSCGDERLELEKILIPARANPKNWRVNVAYKYKGKEHLFSTHKTIVTSLKEYFRLGELMKHAKQKIGDIPRELDKAPLPVMFMNVAAQVLDEDVFNDIKNKAQKAISQP